MQPPNFINYDMYRAAKQLETLKKYELNRVVLTEDQRLRSRMCLAFAQVLCMIHKCPQDLDLIDIQFIVNRHKDFFNGFLYHEMCFDDRQYLAIIEVTVKEIVANKMDVMLYIESKSVKSI